jgi:DNA-binding protein HU-beta
MTKADLVARIAEDADISKKAAQAALNSLVDVVHQQVKSSGRIRIDKLGTFRVIKRKARTGVNPQTGAKIKIPSKKAPAFTAAKALKDIVHTKKGK